MGGEVINTIGEISYTYDVNNYGRGESRELFDDLNLKVYFTVGESDMNFIFYDEISIDDIYDITNIDVEGIEVKANVVLRNYYIKTIGEITTIVIEGYIDEKVTISIGENSQTSLKRRKEFNKELNNVVGVSDDANIEVGEQNVSYNIRLGNEIEVTIKTKLLVKNTINTMLNRSTTMFEIDKVEGFSNEKITVTTRSELSTNFKMPNKIQWVKGEVLSYEYQVYDGEGGKRLIIEGELEQRLQYDTGYLRRDFTAYRNYIISKSNFKNGEISVNLQEKELIDVKLETVESRYGIKADGNIEIYSNITFIIYYRSNYNK